MTDDRPRACTEPPWQYILDRKRREKAAVTVHACRRCNRLYRGERPDGICAVCSSGATDAEDNNPNILR